MILGAAVVFSLGFGAGPVRPDEVELISLKDSLAPFQEHFNSFADQPRFVAVLAPT